MANYDNSTFAALRVAEDVGLTACLSVRMSVAHLVVCPRAAPPDRDYLGLQPGPGHKAVKEAAGA